MSTSARKRYRHLGAAGHRSEQVLTLACSDLGPVLGVQSLYGHSAHYGELDLAEAPVRVLIVDHALGSLAIHHEPVQDGLREGVVLVEVQELLELRACQHEEVVHDLLGPPLLLLAETPTASAGHRTRHVGSTWRKCVRWRNVVPTDTAPANTARRRPFDSARMRSMRQLADGESLDRRVENLEARMERIERRLDPEDDETIVPDADSLPSLRIRF